jgi:hypothetical protein
MSRSSAWLLMLVLLSVPCYAQKVHIDYDTDYDFTQIQTYQWAKPVEFEQNTLMHQRVITAINYQLRMGGAEEVDSDPDVYVTYHSDSREEVNINSSNYGYGYGGGFRYHGGYGGGFGTTTTHVSRYEVGTMVIDIWDGETKNLIWRGTAEATVSKNPAKVEKKITKAIQKLSKKWEKMVAKGL